MSNPSNLYAEKVFSEHPLALWTLDDQLDYLTLLNETHRQMSTFWTFTGATTETITGLTKLPFPDSVSTRIIGNVPASQYAEISGVSNNILNLKSLDLSLKTFCIGTYFYVSTPYIFTISIGYEYTDPNTLSNVQVLKEFSVNEYNQWVHISETFEFPDIDANIRLVFKAKILQGGTPGQYNIDVNGMTLGQWSEEFSTSSFGLTTTTVPSNVSLYSGMKAVEASAYGISSDKGYYLVKSNLLAKNTGVPLVYGASNITKLEPSDKASIIVPGKGFLNKVGQYNEYTVEFWARISCNSSTPFKIFGPISSSDGLYVEGGFLTLVVGNTFASHFVGEWFRPMLIHIRLIKNAVSLLLNGEEVISFAIDTNLLSLPDNYDQSGKSQDWLGFYSSLDTMPFEIDCVSIYSYQVPITVAKRRWVYGQGVLSPEGINAAYGGVTALVDYPFAKYTSNYNYPDFAHWQQATFDNLVTTQTSLRTPEYSLPELFFGSKTIENFYADNKAIQNAQDNFITFRPNLSWDAVPAYIGFPTLNILNDQLHVIYAVVQINDADTSEQSLIKIYNERTGNFFSIRKDGAEIHYYLTFNGVEQEIYRSTVYSIGVPIAIGIDIEGMRESFGGNIAAFFGNTNGLKMYVGGDETGNATFTGYIYSVGFSSAYNESKIEDHFYGGGIYGIANLDAGPQLLKHTASYTLLPTQAYDKFFLDIGVSGYWEDYLPLSYFAQYVKNDGGIKYYDLDFLQFNLGYPEPASVSEKIVDGKTEYYYNTDQSSIKSFLTFQYVADGANSTAVYSNNQTLNQYKVIDIDNYPDWINTKFEILNNTLVYPSKSIDFNDLAIVYSLEFNSRGILNKPILLNRLQICSKVLNHNSVNPIGTRFGVDLFPYKKDGIYYDYKAKNAFSIYKESTPYLYLTKHSGIEVRGQLDAGVNRGLALPVNKQLASNYRISAIQMWFIYNQDLFPTAPVEIFEIQHKTDTVKFYIIANSSSRDRGKIFALTKSGVPFTNLSFFLNGIPVRDPVITKDQWSTLGIRFSTSLVFDSFLGQINVNGPIMFNNLAYYQANSLQEVQSNAKRPWFRVLTDGTTTFDWQFWDNNYTWESMLAIGQSEFYGLNPASIYKAYIGTNKIIVDDQQGLSLNHDKMKVYSDISWSTAVSTPL